MKKLIATEIFTGTHRIRGELVGDATGLFPFINRRTESYIEVENAELCALHEIDGVGQKTSRLWLVKSELAAILVAGRGELGASGVIRAGYTKPFPYSVRVIMTGYMLHGQIHSGGKFNFGAIMFEGDRTFIPLYDAWLSAVLFPKVQAEAAAILFNRDCVESISLQAQG